MKTETHDQVPLFESGLFSDVTLHLYHCMGPSRYIEIRAHKSVLYTSPEVYFHRLVNGLCNGTISQCPETGRDTIRIALDLDSYTEPLLTLFVRLIYMDGISRRTLGPVFATLIEEHLLHFYQLGLYFSFDALTRYCMKRLFAQFSPETLAPFHDHCLLKSPDSDVCTVPTEMMPLYSKLMRWQQYCGGTDHPIPPALCPLPCRGIDCARGHITHQRSVCRECLYSQAHPVLSLHSVELGGVKRRDESQSCSFTLTRDCDAADCQWSLWVTLAQQQQSSDDEHMSVEHSGDEASVPVQAHLSQFSRQLHQVTVSSPKKWLPNDLATQVLSFQLHPLKYCYEGCCGTCERSERPLHIFELSVDIVNKVHIHPYQ